jgi:hypothetical protein
VGRFARLPSGVRGVVALVGGLAIALGAVSAAVAHASPARGSAAGSTLAAVLPDFGNPQGRFPVPPAGRAVETDHPDRVIGNGRPTSCTSAAVVRAVAAGGIIAFNCGAKPVTIVMTSTANVIKTRRLLVLDGGGLITLSGGGKRRILYSNTCEGSWSTGNCVNQPYPQVVVQNITFENGYDGAPQETCTDNIPKCWYGGVNGGGAIYVEGGQFKAVNSRFINNRCYASGPDLGGGAIRVLAQYENRPVYISHDTFRGGRCSNGGALSSIQVQWQILNSVFTDKKAFGWGANPAASGTPGGGSGGAVYIDGKDNDVLIAGTVMAGNSAREGGGAVFDVVNTGFGALTFNESQLHDNVSARFQNFPGVYYELDGTNTVPTVIKSVVS